MVKRANKSNTHFFNIKSIVRVYILVLIIYTLFRLLLFFTQINRLGDSASFGNIFHAFFMGLRFDTVIACYILSISFILLSLKFLIGINSKLFHKIIFGYTFLMFTLSFLVCGADIPFFNQFFSRFSVSAFEWMDNPWFVFKMIAESPELWIYIVPVIFFAIVFYKVLKRILSKPAIVPKPKKIILQSIVSILFLGIIFIGIRGRLAQKSPIRVGTAFFGTDPFLNKLGLNSNFTLIRSYLNNKKAQNQPIHFMPDSTAVANTQNYLGITPSNPKYPLLRKENTNSDSAHYKNVVIVLMESMTVANMRRNGNPDNLTPFLDSISNQGYYFKNFYSAGIHTFNGLFSTLYSFPALYRQHPLKRIPILKYHGISTSLLKLGYTTTFFATHDAQFDNMGGFLRANDFENIISRKDYPENEIKTTLGVPDDYMFRYSMDVLDKLAKKKKPFLSVFLTTSNHNPFYIPDYFHPKQKDIAKQIIEYSDYAMKEFITLSSKKKWFKNTLFVFVADHGKAINPVYDIALNYNHVPLILYSPGFLNKRSISSMGGQIDIYPTIMGLLNLPYENNTLGINLLKEKRPYMYFNEDDKIGVIDKYWLLDFRKDGFIGLYKYRSKDLTNYADKKPNTVSKMKTYAESQMQTFQYIIKTKELKLTK